MYMHFTYIFKHFDKNTNLSNRGGGGG